MPVTFRLRSRSPRELAVPREPPVRAAREPLPSRVPSAISSRMNSASAAKTWKTSRPPGGGGVQGLVQAVEPGTVPAQGADDGDQVGQRPG